MNIEIDNRAVIRHIENLGINAINAIKFDELAAKGKQIILERTDSGNDVDGNAFADYSPSYIAFKSKTHSDLGVNLQYSNNMLNSIVSEGRNEEGIISFADSRMAERAAKHNEGLGVPKREFFGLNDDDSAVLGEMAERHIGIYLDSL